MRRYDDPVEVRRGMVGQPGSQVEAPEQAVALAERLHAALTAPERSILVLVDPSARILEIVTGAEPSATATIDLNSINTRDEGRDTHLRSQDFFDVEYSGPMTFKSTKVEQGGKGLLVTGDLSLKGVTKPVTLDVEYFGTDTDPWGGTRVGFEGTTQISRKEWGVDFNVPMDGGRLLVGDKIDITVSVQAVLQQEQ